VRGGTTTIRPTAGIGPEIVSHPASVATVARPIQIPRMVASTNFVPREMFMKVVRALTTRIINAAVTLSMKI
jgi:hypothetical protein